MAKGVSSLRGMHYSETIVLSSATPLRLAALGLWHEANTFVSRTMDAATMAAQGIVLGEDVRRRFTPGNGSMAGLFAIEDEDPHVTVVPLVMTQMLPRGVITADAFGARVDEIEALLREHGPFDGILAALHGAAVAEGCGDVDGFVLRRIREVVGPDVPIGAALDLHANVSAEMCAHADVLNTYRTNPHLDARETGLEIARLVVGAARREVTPVVAHVSLPLVVNILRQNTNEPPMSDLLELAAEVRAVPGVLTASVIEGFPYADVAEMGMSVVVVTDGDPGLATRCAERLAAGHLGPPPRPRRRRPDGCRGDRRSDGRRRTTRPGAAPRCRRQHRGRQRRRLGDAARRGADGRAGRRPRDHAPTSRRRGRRSPPAWARGWTCGSALASSPRRARRWRAP